MLLTYFLKAPVSLVTALEEYLNDPQFEEKRAEYRYSKINANKKAKEASTSKAADKDKGNVSCIFGTQR